MAKETYAQAKKAVAADQWVLVHKGINPHTGDMELVRRCPCPTRGDAALAQKYIQNYTDIKNDVPGVALPYLTVKDPATVGETHPGTWRAGEIDLIDTAQAANQHDGIVQTLRLGFAATVAAAWSGARVTTSYSFPTNSEYVNGITVPKTTSDNPVWVLFLRLPNIDQRAMNSIVAGLHAYVETTLSGAFTLGGQAYTGMKYLISTSGRSDDGSAFIDVVVATARVTFTLVSNKGARHETRTSVIHDVPADEAQSIATQWEGLVPTQGKSTSISYGGESGRCTVTLSKPGILKDNYTTDWVQIDLHTRRRWHFAWGFTKDELGLWVGTTHNTAITDSVATAEGAAGDDAQTRMVDVSLPRGDGFYDGMIVETRYGSKATPGVPDITMLVYTGRQTTVQHDYGYRFRKHEIIGTDPSVPATQELEAHYIALKAVGTTVDFRITKEDQWVFDWEATITIEGAIGFGTVADPKPFGGSTWMKRSIIQRRHINPTTEATDLALLEATAAGKGLTARMALRDNETLDLDGEVLTPVPVDSGVVNATVKGPILIQQQKLANQTTPPSTSTNQWIEGLQFNMDLATYEYIRYTLALRVNHTTYYSERSKVRERSPHVMQVTLHKKKKTGYVDDYGREVFQDDGWQFWHIMGVWYRDVTTDILVAFSLTPDAPPLPNAPTGENQSITVGQVGEIYVKQTKTVSVGEWGVEGGDKKLWYTVTEEGNIS